MIKFSHFRRVVGMVAVAALLTSTGAALAQQKRVAIANFGEHPKLTILIAGFKKAMAQNGFVEGKDVVYSLSHTNFDASLVPQMITKLQSEKPDLMLTITTPVSQIAKKILSTSGIPIVFAVVTDPVAAKLVPSVNSGDAGMTGASDMLNLASTITFIHQLLPNAKTIGMPYNPGEANDVATMEQMKAAAAANGFNLVTVGVDNANDIQQRIASFKGRADVIYNPSSSLLAVGGSAVAAGARGVNLPVVSAFDDMVRNGSMLASFSLNAEQVGVNAGLIAAKILKGADPKAIAPVFPTLKDHVPLISKKALAALNIKLPASLANCNCLVD